MRPRHPMWQVFAVGGVAASACVTATDDPATDDTTAKKDWHDVCTPETDDSDALWGDCCEPWREACREYEDTGCEWICNG